MHIQVISTTHARKHLSALVNRVRRSRHPIAIGRREKAEALLIRFPEHASPEVDEWTNINQYGGAFDFLEDEPDIYAPDDLIKPYV